MTLSNRSNGDVPKGDRDAQGRFLPGCSGGPGNPAVRRLKEWRDAFEAVITPAELRVVAERLLHAAKAGEPWAVKELLGRTIPEALPLDVMQDLEHVKELLAARGLIERN